MNHINSLKRQHQEIAEVLTKIDTIIKDQQVSERSFDLTMSIGLLAGKLLTHLSSEDKYLYPSLVNHPDLTTKTISKNFMKEMGSLFNTFSDYKKKYMVVKNIKERPEEFVRETRLIFEAIKKRVSAEESKLYPLLN